MSADGRASVSMPARRVFHDDTHESAWRDDGFLVVGDVDAEVLAALTAAVQRVYRGGSSGFHSTLQSDDPVYRREVFDTFPELLRPFADELLIGYEPFAASLTVKWPGDDSALCSHQDWSMVDEEQFRTINLWCPLVPTGEVNGAIRVLRASHRVLDHLRCSPTNPVDFECGANAVPLDELERVDTELGQVVVFDQGVLHGSGPNRSDEWRPAITVAFKPVEAQLLHHHVPDPTRPEVDVYEVDPAFFTEIRIGSAPDRPRAAVRPFHGTPMDAEQIVVRSHELAAPSGPRSDADPPGRRPTMRDPDLQAEFAERGYVVVDLLDAEQVDELRAIADREFTGEPAGMHATNMCPDPQYRRRVFEALQPVLEPIAAPLFDDYVAMTGILLMKFPGEDSQFVSHQDWTLVDEERFRAVNVWCPLVDVGPENGTISVVPGSHELLRSVRCDPTYPASYQPPGWSVRPEDMVPLSLRTGQAVIFDLALLHSSPPNRSDRVRSAVALTMTPRCADLLHWYLPDPGADELEVYRVDSDYLVDFELGTRPGYPLVGTVPFVPDTVEPAELRELCGAGVGGRAAGASGEPPVDSPYEPAAGQPAVGTDPVPSGPTPRRPWGRRVIGRARRWSGRVGS